MWNEVLYFSDIIYDFCGFQDEVVARIEERISAWTFIPKGDFPCLKLCFLELFVFFAIHLSLCMSYIYFHPTTLSENGRPLQVLHFYSEESKQNHDYFGKEFKTLSNEPLMATVVLYLSNTSQGGQIIFPESEVREKQLSLNIRPCLN